MDGSVFAAVRVPSGVPAVGVARQPGIGQEFDTVRIAQIASARQMDRVCAAGHHDVGSPGRFPKRTRAKDIRIP